MTKPLGTIAFIVDERISRDRTQILARVITALRTEAQVEVLSSGGTTEDDFLKRLKTQKYNLVLAPWYLYLKWSRVEAALGSRRSSGTAFAGYYADLTTPAEIGPCPGGLRQILLDFVHLQPAEALLLIRALALETHRSGIRPLLAPGTRIYCENWWRNQGAGPRLDAVTGLAELGQHEWRKRAGSIRVALLALWSLIFEEGPGKNDAPAGPAPKAPRAHFQIGVDAQCLALRLCYAQPGSSSREDVAEFWPDDTRPSAASQLLLRHADFVRIHHVADRPEIEIVAGFLASAPSEKAPKYCRTLWIDPIGPQLVHEAFQEAPGPAAPHLRLLPVASLGEQRPKPVDSDSKNKDRFMFEAAVKIREFKKALEEKEEQIRELRSGGVGTAPPLPPPETEDLLEAFQERYFDAKFQIRQLELKVADAEKNGASPQELAALQQKIAALANREKAWIKKIAQTIEAAKARKKG